MAETSIAKTSIKVTTDAKDARTGLEKFGGEVRQWAEKQSTALGGQFSAALRGGLIGGFLGGSLQSQVEGLVEGVKRWVTGAGQAEAVYAGVVAQLKQAGVEQDRLLAKSAEQRKSMMSWGDELLSIDADLAKLSAEWNKLNDQVLAGEKQIAARNEGPFGGLGFNAVAIGRIEEINSKLNATQTEIGEKIRKLQEERERTLDPSKNEAFKLAIAQTTRELENQIAAWGLTGEAAQRALFKASGANDEMLRRFDKAAEELKRLRDLNAAPPPWLGTALGFAGTIGKQLSGGMQSAAPWLGAALGSIGTIQDLIAKAPTLKTDNAALLRGSSAEVSARTRSDSRIMNAAEQQLAEARKQSALLEQVKTAAADTATAVGKLAPLGVF